MPKFTDGFNLEASSKLDLGGAEKFLSYDDSSGALAISVPSNILQGFVGTYNAKLTLTDKRGSQREYDFKINVVLFAKAAEKVEMVFKTQSPPKPYIKELN